MKITKLHLILFVLISALAGGGLYVARSRQLKEDARIAAEKEARRRADALAMEQKFVAPAPPPQAAPQAPAQPQVSSATYTVQKGDTLWKIAKKAEHFGQGHRWYDIWKANEAIVDDFDRIEVGQTLVVPISVADGHAWPSTPQEKRDRLMRVGADGVAEEAPEEELTN